MKTEHTRITSVNVHVGEVPIQGVYMKQGIFNDLYGFLLLSDVSLVFNSKESICALQDALTELKEKWLVEEQKEVPERA